MALEDELAAVKAELKLLTAQLPNVVRRALREHEEERQYAEIIDCSGLAPLLGCPLDSKTPPAVLARKRVMRDHDLQSIAIAGGAKEHWRWRRRDVESLLRARRTASRAQRA